MEIPAVSLVLCTRNRAERLRSCLGYIAQQEPHCAWELVVVDNGSTDRTGEILKEFAANVRFPTKILYQAPSGKSRALNQAFQVTDAEIIASIDDDCYIAPDYIDRVWETFADPQNGFAGGRVDLFDPTDYPITIKTSKDRELFKPQSLIPGGALLGANTMYRRRVLEDIGGFDPDLGPGSHFYGEEMDVQTLRKFCWLVGDLHPGCCRRPPSWSKSRGYPAVEAHL